MRDKFFIEFIKRQNPGTKMTDEEILKLQVKVIWDEAWEARGRWVWPEVIN